MCYIIINFKLIFKYFLQIVYIFIIIVIIIIIEKISFIVIQARYSTYSRYIDMNEFIESK